MSHPEDSDGAGDRSKPQWFATTHWSVVLAAKDCSSPEADAALENLCRSYWPPLYAYKAAEDKLTALALSSDGKILASGAGYAESAIRLWDVASGQEISRLPGHRTYVAALLFWPDSSTLASASGDQTIRLWDIRSLTNVLPLRVLRGHKQEVWRLALLPDNATLVSGSKDGSVCFWDTTASRQQRTRIILGKEKRPRPPSRKCHFGPFMQRTIRMLA